MRKYLTRLLGFLAILCAIFTAALFLIPANKHHFVYAHHNKMEILESHPSPRIILVGGSNLAFGLDCEQIEQHLATPVINTGTHAAIGLRFVADEVISRIHKGDTAVFMPEYAQFFGMYNGGNETLTDAVIYSGTKSLRLLSFRQWLQFIEGTPKHIKGNLAQIPLTGTWTYRADGFNQWGDESSHWSQNHGPIAEKALPCTGPADMAAFDDFSEKIKKVKEKGATPIILWPITIESNYQANREAISIIKREIESRGAQFGADAHYFVLPDSLAFDTPYHSSRRGVDLSTQKLIRLLRP